MERFENRNGVRELGNFSLHEQESSGCVEAAVSGGDCRDILTFLTFFIPAVNRPIVLTYHVLLNEYVMLCYFCRPTARPIRFLYAWH